MESILIPCHYCGERFFFGQLTKDHVVPQSKGGRDIVENLVPSCGPCNSVKADNMPTCTCDFCLNALEYYEHQYEGNPVTRVRYASYSRKKNFGMG